MNLVAIFRQMNLDGKEALRLCTNGIVNQLSKGFGENPDFGGSDPSTWSLQEMYQEV